MQRLKVSVTALWFDADLLGMPAATGQAQTMQLLLRSCDARNETTRNLHGKSVQ
jgi:hypothetical protein